MLYALYKHVLIGPALRLIARPQVLGAENVPREGPVVLAANHLAEIDSAVLALACPRRVAFLAKIEYFQGRGVRGRLLRQFFSSTGQIPVDRSGGDSTALDAAIRHLNRGRVWAVYPEGTRSPDGALHRGHTGLARVAGQVPGAWIVPVAIAGTEHINPPAGRLTRGRCSLRFGAPIRAGELIEEFGIRGTTDQLMARIAELSGQRYIDRYATPRARCDDGTLRR